MKTKRSTSWSPEYIDRLRAQAARAESLAAQLAEARGIIQLADDLLFDNCEAASRKFRQKAIPFLAKP